MRGVSFSAAMREAAFIRFSAARTLAGPILARWRIPGMLGATPRSVRWDYFPAAFSHQFPWLSDRRTRCRGRSPSLTVNHSLNCRISIRRLAICAPNWRFLRLIVLFSARLWISLVLYTNHNPDSSCRNRNICRHSSAVRDSIWVWREALPRGEGQDA